MSDCCVTRSWAAGARCFKTRSGRAARDSGQGGRAAQPRREGPGQTSRVACTWSGTQHAPCAAHAAVGVLHVCVSRWKHSITLGPMLAVTGKTYTKARALSMHGYCRHHCGGALFPAQSRTFKQKCSAASCPRQQLLAAASRVWTSRMHEAMRYNALQPPPPMP